MRGVTVSGNAFDGIRLVNQSVLSLVDSAVTDNELTGLHLETSVASVRSNRVTGNMRFGIFVDDESLVSGYENTITGNEMDVSDSVPEDLTLPRQQGIGD